MDGFFIGWRKLERPSLQQKNMPDSLQIHIFWTH